MKQLSVTEKIDRVRSYGSLEDGKIFTLIADLFQELIKPGDELIYMTDIKTITGLSAQRIYALRIEDKTFPVRKRKGGGKLYAFRAELMAWFEGRHSNKVIVDLKQEQTFDLIAERQRLNDLLGLRRRGWVDNEAELNAEIVACLEGIYQYQPNELSID